jgi:probable rRNA maturation factor
MPPEGSTFLIKKAPAGLDRKRLRAFQKTLIAEVAQGRPFTCLLTGDAELQRLNARFLALDYPTDVLSFPAADGESLGDVAISTQRAQEQAQQFGHSTEEEIQILMLHGLLHLLGHDHEQDRGRMRRVETRWRRHYQLPAGLIERAKR